MTNATFQDIPLEQIAPSKTNPRKTFLEIDELAEDLKAHGMISPVLVRPHPKPNGVQYELVCGERRWRAGKKASLATVPAVVRELDDAKALELQIVENSQRMDVHPLEESEGYERLHNEHGLSVEEIAAKVGKTAATVYSRMKLCALCPDVRKAFYAEKISAVIALYIARVPHADLQKEALKEILDHSEEGSPLSAREAHRIIVNRFMLRMADAPFNKGDKNLLAKAGDCMSCPKRSGNQKELFADVGSVDVCTDPKCWDLKRLGSLATKENQLEEKGTKVVHGEIERSSWGQSKMKPPPGYAPLDHYDYERGGRLSDLIKRHKLEPKSVVMFDEAGKAVPLVRIAEIPKKRPPESSKSSSVSSAKATAAQKNAAARKRAVDSVEKTVLSLFTKKPDIELALHIAADELAYQVGQRKDSEKLSKLSGKKLAIAVVEMLVKGQGYALEEDQEDEDVEADAPSIVALCKRYKIDWRKAIADEVAKVASKDAKPKGKKK